MFKKMSLISLVIVLVLTITGFSSAKAYDNYNLSGEGTNWQIDDAVLFTTDTSQVLNAGTLIFAGDDAVKLAYLEINVLDTDTDNALLLFRDHYVDYPQVFDVQEAFNIGGIPIHFAEDKSSRNLAIEVTYSLADSNEIVKDIIELK